jgi:hypothetical protein
MLGAAGMLAAAAAAGASAGLLASCAQPGPLVLPHHSWLGHGAASPAAYAVAGVSCSVPSLWHRLTFPVEVR